MGNYVINHYKDSYEPTSIMESKKFLFFFVARVTCVEVAAGENVFLSASGCL